MLFDETEVVGLGASSGAVLEAINDCHWAGGWLIFVTLLF